VNRKNNNLKFFEFGKTYTRDEKGFIEIEQLCLYVSGNYLLPHWTEKAKTVDVYFVRGILESLFPNLKLTFEMNENGLTVLFQNRPIGSIQAVAASKLKNFDIKQAVWFVELNWEKLKNAIDNYKLKFTEIPKFPVMQRDLAMIVDKQIQYHQIEVAVKQAKSKLLQSVNLFDVFESEKLGLDKKSLAVNFSFYDNQKTLTDIEVEAEMKNIINSLEQKVGAVVRGN
jgi:phenylalanyl-tRNA synthetase beta chain